VLDGRFGVEPSAKTCNYKLQPNHQSYTYLLTYLLTYCHLANTDEYLGGLATAILPFVNLLWAMFSDLTVLLLLQIDCFLTQLCIKVPIVIDITGVNRLRVECFSPQDSHE